MTHTLQVTGAVLLVLLQPSFKFGCVSGEISKTCEGSDRPNSIPVVLIHWGLRDCSHCHANPLFLQQSVDVARRSGNRVILLGDDESKQVSGAEWHNVGLYMDSAAEFQKVYQHLSSNAHSYEMACFQRMFVLRDFMRAQGFAAALHIDSDVMLLANINDVVDPECLSTGAAAWLRPVQEYTDWWWVESVATAIFSLSLLDDLCAFMLDLYTTPQGLALLQQKMDGWVVERGGEGGVCDMTAYFLFSNCVSASLSDSTSPRPNAFPDPEEVCPRIRRLVDVGDLTGEWERARQKDAQQHVDFGAVQSCAKGIGVFDLNINEANGFRMACDDEQQRTGCIKAIAWRSGEAWASLGEDGSEVRLLSLHLQGGAKSRMESLAVAFEKSLLHAEQ